MDHTPFIWGAYLIAGAVLLAVALAPQLGIRRTLTGLQTALHAPERKDQHAPHP